ncbi:hypothetical protein [Massilia sp. YIM B02443]|uniref:hypothetical protein n=1 Tax=Massilia sp. YIM B02443 TaxID=3050127 RepID=UPI0025B6376C|nr:hypothetical protein [Massilia sp. YIM B02443]MDN4038354.1 hypothetical protein [Massilia sp. YIM B02443]
MTKPEQTQVTTTPLSSTTNTSGGTRPEETIAGASFTAQRAPAAATTAATMQLAPVATTAAAPAPSAATDAASAPSAAPTPPQEGALSSMQGVIELADQLSAFADQLHERIMADIRDHGTGRFPEHTQDVLRALLDDEMLLRQRANSLYADAAAFIIHDLGRPQGQLVGLTKDAAQKIRRIGVIGEAAGLVGGLLSLAGAAMAGQPAGVVLALDKIRLHNDALQVLSPTPPTAAA